MTVRILYASILITTLWILNARADLPPLSTQTLISPDYGVTFHEIRQSSNGSTTPAIKEDFVTGVFSAFTVTAVSEIGDKTFFIAAVLSLSNSPIYVYAGALTALGLMTVLSAGLGLVFSIMSTIWVQFLSAFLFFIFGLKMLKEGCAMKSDAGKEELEEVQKSIEDKFSGKEKTIMTHDVEAGTMRMAVRWVLLEAFTMTFLSEWGDRSQIATVILAAKHNFIGVMLGSTLGHAACTLLAVAGGKLAADHNFIGVMLGSTLGHAACTLLAVAGGKLVADHISIRTVTLFGALLFLAFALTSFIGAVDEAMVTGES